MRKIGLSHSFVLGLISALVCSLLSVLSVPSHASPELIREATTLTVCTSLKTSIKILSKTNTCNERIYETSTWFEEGEAPEGTPNSKIISILTCQSKSNSKSIIIRNTCNPHSQISKKWERPLGPPGAPKIVSVSADKLGTAKVLAQESINNGGARVTHFTLSAINNSAPEKSVRASSSVTASKVNVIQVKGLTPGETYNFQLTATNVAGTSQYSSAIEPFVAPTIPNTPSITSALATGPTSATISFSAPTFDGGSPIIKYTVKSSNGISRSIDSSLLNGKFNFEGLSPLTSYIFTMTAENVSGESSPSVESVSITTFAPLPPPISISPSAPIAPSAPSSPLAEPAFTLSRNSLTRIVNQPGDGFTVLSTGGLIDSFLISSSIPGMNFNATTGELSGTPTQVATVQTYTVTALNNSGSATATFTLGVEDETVANPAFTISSSSETVTAGSAITGYTINSTGGPIANFNLASPQTLPSGLTFDRSTGLLSGTPGSSAEATNYVIEGTNLNGLASATFTLTVLSRASKVAITRASVGTESGVAFTTQPRITIQDSSNNTVLSSTAVVIATISAGGTLVGTTTATASAGVATFTNLGVSGTVGTTYTITYTAVGLTVATATVKVSRYCDGSFACNVGDTGPGGGIIFYAAFNPFECGPTLNLLCKYLEAAPWSGARDQWSRADFAVTLLEGVGTGYKNSLEIQAAASANSTNSPAASRSLDYVNNGVDDWYLPSKDELSELISKRSVLPVIGDTQYWSSSSHSNPDPIFNTVASALTLYSNSVSQGYEAKVNSLWFRPIRAFMSPATNVRITRESVGTEKNVAFTTQPQITIQDTSGNVIANHVVTVTASISAGGTLVGSTAANTVSGVATFTNLGVSGTVGTTYTITYTAVGLTVATATVKVSRYCDGSFACNVGDTGPGGGIIFYAALSDFVCGSTSNLTCKYLEAAPLSGVNAWTDIQTSWSGNVTEHVTTSEVIGSGYQNTLAIIARRSGGGTDGKAGTAAQAFRGPNGKSDWYLPSKSELDLLYQNNAIVGGFPDVAWSSTELNSANPRAVWVQYGQGFPGRQATFDKSNLVTVRPIRAFGAPALSQT